MAEDLTIIRGSKEEQYLALIPQIKALIEGETDLVANLANITGALKEQFGWFWVGVLSGKRRTTGTGTFPGPRSLYPDQQRPWRMR